MKNLAFTILLLLIAATIYPQVPNGNFEEWETVDSIEVPKYWTISNEFCCYEVEKVIDAIEGEFSLKLSVHTPTGLIPEWLAETTVQVGQVYQSLNAAIRIDSMYWGKVAIKVLELKNGIYQEIGNWETTETTNGAKQISVPLNQTQTDSLKIQLNAMIVNPTQLPVGYAGLIVDEIELSLTTSTGEQNRLEELVRIYPNPTSGIVNIEYPNDFNPKIARLYDSEGKLVLVSENVDFIDLNGFPIDTYLLVIQAYIGTNIARFVQKR